MDTQAIPSINNLQKYSDTQYELVSTGKIEEAKARVASGKPTWIATELFM